MEINIARLVELRQDRGWGQRELAAAVGMSVRTIEKYELEGPQGRRPSPAAFARLAAALGVEPQELRATAE